MIHPLQKQTFCIDFVINNHKIHTFADKRHVIVMFIQRYGRQMDVVSTFYTDLDICFDISLQIETKRDREIKKSIGETKIEYFLHNKDTKTNRMR